MPHRVKICGLTTLADAQVALEAGADALGFILYPRSPRYINPEQAQKILEQLPPFVETVAVLVNPSEEEVRVLAQQTQFTLWQLHGQESPAFAQSLAPRRLIKALALPTPLSAQELESYPVSAFLLDTPSPQHGGTGQTFDWTLVESFRTLTSRKVILSGGLNVHNVAHAIQAVHPYAVDVSSGVEISPGKKDHALVRHFISLAKNL